MACGIDTTNRYSVSSGFMSLIKEKLLEKISELEYPTIQNLSNELQTNRQYVSVLLNSLKEEGIVSFSEIGNNKIWKVVENGK